MISVVLTKYRCILPSRQLSTSIKFLAKETEAEIETIAPESILQELSKPKLNEEEIMQKRFKARLPEIVYRKQIAREAVPLIQKYDFQLFRLRRYYGKFGKATKLNPGLCWPRREEILDIMEADRTLDPPLQVKIENLEARRIEEEEKKRAVEEQVDRNMANLDKWMAEYHDKNKKKDEKAFQLREEREKLVEEISEYLGYDIDHRDPRFKEAVEQRNKDKKKAMKVKKQQESYDKMLDKLKKIAQSKTV